MDGHWKYLDEFESAINSSRALQTTPRYLESLACFLRMFLFPTWDEPIDEMNQLASKWLQFQDAVIPHDAATRLFPIPLECLSSGVSDFMYVYPGSGLYSGTTCVRGANMVDTALAVRQLWISPHARVLLVATYFRMLQHNVANSVLCAVAELAPRLWGWPQVRSSKSDTLKRLKAAWPTIKEELQVLVLPTFASVERCLWGLGETLSERRRYVFGQPVSELVVYFGVDETLLGSHDAYTAVEYDDDENARPLEV